MKMLEAEQEGSCLRKEWAGDEGRKEIKRETARHEGWSSWGASFPETQQTVYSQSKQTVFGRGWKTSDRIQRSFIHWMPDTWNQGREERNDDDDKKSKCTKRIKSIQETTHYYERPSLHSLWIQQQKPTDFNNMKKDMGCSTIRNTQESTRKQ